MRWCTRSEKLRRECVYIDAGSVGASCGESLAAAHIVAPEAQWTIELPNQQNLIVQRCSAHRRKTILICSSYPAAICRFVVYVLMVQLR